MVIGSTNRPEALDPALRRPGRFDLEIEFDPPNVDERKEVLKILFNNYLSGRFTGIKLDEIAEQTIGFTGADLLQLLNESLLQEALEGRDYVTQEDLLKAKNSVKPSALREFTIEKPKNRIDEIKNGGIINKIYRMAEDFCREPYFKPVLLHQPLQLANKIASLIAYIVCGRPHSLYVVVRAT